MTAAIQRVCAVWFSALDRWIVPSAAIRDRPLPVGWRIAQIGSLVRQIADRVKVTPDAEYRMVGVKWYGEGTFHRETVRGDSLSATYVIPVVPGAFIYNRLFAWKASFAVVPPEHAGCFVSGEFPQFMAEAGQVLPEYLLHWFTSPTTLKTVNAASVGSAAVSRNRFKERAFLELEMLLPPLATQRTILAEWQKARQAIETAEKSAESLAASWNDLLLTKIGITVEAPNPRRGAFVVQSDSFDRWDTFFYRPDFISLDRQLRKIRSGQLGDLLHFVSRPWTARDFPQGFFRYVEISNVSSESGITTCREVDVDKSPSRATTLIRKNDIIISTIRPYLGAFAQVDADYDGCVCSSGFAVADGVKSPDIDPGYLLLFLKSAAGLRQMERRMTGGLYPAIIQDQLENIFIPLPSKNVQQEILTMHHEVCRRIAKERETARARSRQIEADMEEYLLGTKKVGKA